jgi:hypothetical protein
MIEKRNVMPNSTETPYQHILGEGLILRAAADEHDVERY